LRDVYERLGSRLGSKKQPREISDFFAGGAGVLLLIGGGLSALWFRRVP
jgi:Ca-activated chloride channel family protein